MADRKPKIVYWVNNNTPYMVDRWNAVVEEGELDLEVWLSWKTDPNLGWNFDTSKWKFRYSYLPNIKIGNRSFPIPTALLRRSKPDVIISFYADPWFLLGWVASKLRGIKTGFWVESTSDAWTRRMRVKEAMKHWLLPKADGLITTGPIGKEFCLKYGADEENVFQAPMGVDVETFRRLAMSRLSDRDDIRQALGLEGTVFLFVGRLWHGKGIHTLLDAYRRIRECRQDVSLLIVGKGDEEEHIKTRCASEKIEGVVLEPFRQRDTLADVFVASDVFVFPTTGDTYGLVIDEAMTCNLPIVASNVGEIPVRVENGVNGFLTQPGDVDTLFQRMFELADNPELRQKMGTASWPKISHNTPAQFSKNFHAAISAMLE